MNQEVLSFEKDDFERVMKGTTNGVRPLFVDFSSCSVLRVFREGEVARKLRIQYPGALYHVINRGNYRRDLFENVGTAEAFLNALFEATAKFTWNLHAFTLMRNHFHLALETPEPTLVEGMHWLQSTMATRFNRYRGESGHLFQGRYKSILVEDFSALGRVVDYIHLNPVRAKIVFAEQVTSYRWSSLPRFVRGTKPIGLTASEWLRARGGWEEDALGWKAYEAHLVELGKNESRWEQEGLVGLSKGWAIGTAGWRRAIAEKHAQLALNPGLDFDEVQELRHGLWASSLARNLAIAKKTRVELDTRPRKQRWKVELARTIRNETGASIGWLASNLGLGKPASLRSYLARS